MKILLIKHNLVSLFYRSSSVVLTAIIAIILCYSGISYQQEVTDENNIHVATPAWPKQTNSDGTGLYFDILRAVFEPNGIQLTYEFVPWKRAVAMVDHKDADALLGAYYNPKLPSLFSRCPIDTEVTVVVYKKGTINKWEGQKSIKDKRIAWPRGYNYHKYLNVPVIVHEVNIQQQGWSLINAGRDDFYMDARGDVRVYIKENHIDINAYEIEPIITKYLYVRFAVTEKSKNLIKIFDKEGERLIKTGIMEKLFKKWDWPYTQFVLREE